jgi:hypothetical protein
VIAAIVLEDVRQLIAVVAVLNVLPVISVVPSRRACRSRCSATLVIPLGGGRDSRSGREVHARLQPRISVNSVIGSVPHR